MFNSTAALSQPNHSYINSQQANQIPMQTGLQASYGAIAPKQPSICQIQQHLLPVLNQLAALLNNPSSANSNNNTASPVNQAGHFQPSSGPSLLINQQIQQIQANEATSRANRINGLQGHIPMITAQGIGQMKSDINRLQVEEKQLITQVMQHRNQGGQINGLLSHQLKALQSTKNFIEYSLSHAQNVYQKKEVIAQQAHAEGQTLGRLMASGKANHADYISSKPIQQLEAQRQYVIALEQSEAPRLSIVSEGYQLSELQHIQTAFTAGVQSTINSKHVAKPIAA